MSAAGEYKDVIGELTVAAEALRERDRVRAEQIARVLVDLHARMARAEERAVLSRALAELHWQDVLEALWNESWMTLKLRPRPELSADPARLDALDEALAAAATAVQEAVRRSLFGLPLG